LRTIEDRLIVGTDAPMVEQSTGPKDMGVQAFAFHIKRNRSAAHGKKDLSKSSKIDGSLSLIRLNPKIFGRYIVH